MRRKRGERAGPQARAAGAAAGDGGGPQRRLRPARPRAVGRHRVRGQRQRDRVRRRADPQRPGRRGADRRRRRLLGHPLRRVQLAGVAIAGARSPVLARPQRALARRGQRHVGVDARGSRARARRPGAGRDPGVRPLGRRLPPNRAASRRPRRRARDPDGAGPGRRVARARSATSTATAPARPRTTPRRPPRRRSASARRPRGAPP